MNRKPVLWFVPLGGLAATLALILSLSASSRVASADSGRVIVPGRAIESASRESPSSVLPAPSDSQASAQLFPNCRYGVAAWPDQLSQFDIVSELSAGWYLDFRTLITPLGPAEAEYVQMVHVVQGQSRRGGTDICGPAYGFTVTPPLTDTGLGARIVANPGSLWLVGNEPDRRTVQDDICPQQYAEGYHDVYQYIKGLDPTAQVAVAGLVEVTPGRLQYLDIVWDTYREKYGATMPVDVWTMHIYVLSEQDEGDAHVALGTDPNLAIPHSYFCPDTNSICQAEHDDMDLFQGQVIQMREWMAQHGQQNKPLLITEFGILKPYNYYGTCPGLTTCPIEGGYDGCFCDENRVTFHPERVADFLENAFDYLMSESDAQTGYPADSYRLVQGWLWYRLATWHSQDLAHASNLAFTNTYTLTVPGQRWRGYVAALTPTVNLLPADVPVLVEHAANGTDPVTVTLSAEVRNNGNIAVTGTVTVTFYSDQLLTTPIATTAFTTALSGCALRGTVVTTTWQNLDTGLHRFWVKVDSSEAITETLETDNVAQGMVLVNPLTFYLPLFSREW